MPTAPVLIAAVAYRLAPWSIDVADAYLLIEVGFVVLLAMTHGILAMKLRLSNSAKQTLLAVEQTLDDVTGPHNRAAFLAANDNILRQTDAADRAPASPTSTAIISKRSMTA